MKALILGGQRSGKSTRAEALALSLSDNPLYLATSRSYDDDHRQRIELHRARRDSRWQTIERERDIAGIELSGRTVLLECLTLWLTNLFLDNDEQLDPTHREAIEQLERFLPQPEHLIIVSSEVGLSIHPTTASGRKFIDLQGAINQYIASRVDLVDLVVAGIPLTIKGA